MKEKITYMSSPMSFFTRWPISTRVLTTVMENQGFNVEFFDASLFCYSKAVSKFKNDIKIELNSPHAILTNNAVGGATSNFSRFPHFYVGAGMLDDFILESIKTDVVFYSAPFAQDFRIVKFLLDNGKKVLLGGTATLIYKINSIRNSLRELGATEEQLKSLCIVEGYVDQSTPLKDIYKKWKDHVIQSNDLASIWDCKEDYSLNNKKIYEKLFNTNLGLVLNTSCWWGKCKYCTFYCVPETDFIKDMSDKDVIKKILALGDLYDSRDIYFFDSYLQGTKRNKNIVSALRDEGYKLGTYTGLHLFLNKNYITDFINRGQIDSFIGLEHTNTETLKAINKGLNFEQTNLALNNMLRYMDKTVRPVMCIMADLPIIADSREKAIKIIKDNYQYIIDKKELFTKEGMSNGIGFQPDLKSLRHLPLNTLVTKNGLIREATPEEFNLNDLIGIWALYLYMSNESGVKLDKFDMKTNKPLVRFLPNGERLESDLYFMDNEVVRELSTWR
jgi:hypothetical protein